MTPAVLSRSIVRGSRAARRRRRALQGRRGVALIMVLGALTVLTILLADFQDETSANVGAALSARDALRAEYAARSGVALARLLIAAEPTIRQTLAPLMMLMGGGQAPPQIPVWEFADEVLGAFNDEAGGQKFAALSGVNLGEGRNLGIEGAGFDLTIVDEDSKINLNAASREAFSQGLVIAELLGLIGSAQFDPLFSGRDGDGQFSDRQTVCGAIVDWVDRDQDASPCDPRALQQASSAAPEDSFYQLLDPGYQRKNAPLDSLDELRRVRGVGDDFWATFVDPDPDDPSKRPVTVWGQGRVNVNTANAQTLLAVICGGTFPPAKVCLDPLEATKFLGLVQMIRTFTKGAPLFSSPKGFVNTLKQRSPIGLFLKQIGLEPITFVSDAATMKALTAESKVFTLLSRGYVRAGKRETRTRVQAVVDFRGAPPPPQQLELLVRSGYLGAPPPQMAAPGALGAGSAEAAIGEDGYAAFLTPSPGGRIVYFRVD